MDIENNRTALILKCFDTFRDTIKRYSEEDNHNNLVNNKVFDGKSYLNTLKPYLDAISCEIEWDTNNLKRLYYELTDKTTIPDKKMFPNEYDDTMVKEIGLDERNPDGSMNAKNHFFIQLFRIPLYEANTFTKLMQVALNIGLLLPYIDTFDNGYTDFFVVNRMDKIDTYLKGVKYCNNDDEVKKITDLINIMKESSIEVMEKMDKKEDEEIQDYAPDENMNGGKNKKGYYYKYMKYKHKLHDLNKLTK